MDPRLTIFEHLALLSENHVRDLIEPPFLVNFCELDDLRMLLRMTFNLQGQ